MDSLFREAFESRNNDNTALLHLVHLAPSDDLEHVDVCGRFLGVFFPGFVV
jgi:hypothetical protein